MSGKGNLRRYGALMLALSTVLAPGQIARANIDPLATQEAPAGRHDPSTTAQRPVQPMTRFMAATPGVNLGVADFSKLDEEEPVHRPDVASANGGLRFASVGYEPYLPSLGSPFKPREDLAPIGSDGAPVAIFGSVAIPVAGSVHAGRWRQVLGERADAVLSAPCGVGRDDCGNALMRKAREIVRAAREMDRDGKVRLINRFVNASIRYGTDREIYGTADHWATLAETFARGRGDCEDIALAKMWMLRAAGIDLADMHLTLGRQTRLREDHAILVVKAGAGRNFYMDNLTSSVEPLDGRGEFQPLVSYGANGAWIHGYRAARQS
jgi:predicted transglutaminase-like cysteine proteinase